MKIYTECKENQKINVYEFDAETYESAKKYLTTRATARKHAHLRGRGRGWIAEIVFDGEPRGYLAEGEYCTLEERTIVENGKIKRIYSVEALELYGRGGKSLYLKYTI